MFNFTYLALILVNNVPCLTRYRLGDIPIFGLCKMFLKLTGERMRIF